MDGITSTSVDPGVAASWGSSGVTLEITTKKGLFVESHTQNSGEFEMLLDHAQEYYVVGVKTVKVNVHGHVREQKVVQLVHMGDATSEATGLAFRRGKADEPAAIDKFLQDAEFIYILED
jgi:hypothetical protein